MLGSGPPSAHSMLPLGAPTPSSPSPRIREQDLGLSCPQPEMISSDEAGETLMKQAFDAMGLTARSYDRILKVARTVADMSGSERITCDHIAEAIQYRTVEL